MCPDKYGYGGWRYYSNLLYETDGYFPKCSCPSPTKCGPDLCECLESDANGDILQCMDPLKQLCEGTKMEECLRDKFRAIRYCSMLPCFVVVHFMSANVSIAIDVARNTEMLGIAQGLNAARPKLMMRGGRLA
jgi:hypothetical protein